MYKEKKTKWYNKIALKSRLCHSVRIWTKIKSLIMFLKHFILLHVCISEVKLELLCKCDAKPGRSMNYKVKEVERAARNLKGEMQYVYRVLSLDILAAKCEVSTVTVMQNCPLYYILFIIVLYIIRSLFKMHEQHFNVVAAWWVTFFNFNYLLD